MATKKSSPKEKFDLYQVVTDKIVAALENGVVPWHKPWRSMLGDDAHRNFVSKKAYRGINVFMLDIVAASEGYDLPYWLTYKQAVKLGGGIRKGEKGTLVTFWKRIPIKVEENGEEKTKVIPMLRYFSVFNVAQTEGLEERIAKLQPDSAETFNPILRAGEIIANMPKRPSTRHGGDRAFYRPSADTVTLPKPEAFDAPKYYYATAFHEYVHATGHESRIGRVKDWTTFGSEPYAKEELVAEMGAAMLSRAANIETEHEESAAYIASWLGKLKDDKKFVVNAAAQAQRAADFILGVSYDEKPE